MSTNGPPAVDPEAEGDTQRGSGGSTGRSRGTKKRNPVYIKKRYGTVQYEPGVECQHCDEVAIGVFAEGSSKRDRKTDGDVIPMCSKHKSHREYNYAKSHSDLEWAFYHFAGYKEVSRVGEEKDVHFLGTVQCARCGSEAVGALIPIEGEDVEKFPDGIALCESDWEDISEDINMEKYKWSRKKP